MHTIFPRLATIFSACLLACSPVLAQSDTPAGRLDCSNGPVAKSFGGSPWLVFGCSDGTSLVVVSTEENRSHPFFFKLFLKDGKRYVVAEGGGTKPVTAAAYAELEKLSEADITALVGAALAAPKSAAPNPAAQ